MVPYIACREDSWNISLSFVLRHNVSLLIEIDDSFEDLGVRLIAYSDEDAISCQRSRFSTLHILKSYSADLLISQNLSHLRIPSKLDSGIIHHSVLHDLVARSLSLRWIIVTFRVIFARNDASSIAVSPPPTTATSLSLKKKPSQVAQLDTPFPLNFASEGISSHFAFAPVAIITVLP